MKRTVLLSILLIVALPGLLSAGDFSGWSQASTKHFVFVYEKRDKAAVDELLAIAEGVYSEVTAFFGSYPTKIWVVVDGRVDTANGYFLAGTEVPAHLVLYLTSPSVQVLGSKQRQYLRLLLTHELTHYVHLDDEKGFFATLSHIFGPALRPGDSFFLPDWMKEGVAVNAETMFTDGGRGRDPYFEMEYRALLLENRLFSLKQAAYASAFPPEDRVYLGGYLLVHYLLTHYGVDSFAKIQQHFAKFPFFGPWAAIKKVTGESAAEIYRQMERDLKAEYARDALVPAGRLVSPERIGNYHLPVITERGWYGYRSNLDSPPAIVRYEPSTGRTRVLLDTSLTDYTSLTASRDGRSIVFASLDLTLGPAGTSALSDLFSLDPETRKVRRITKSAHLWQPALSPDGTMLVAVQRNGTYSRLVTVNESSGSVIPLYSLPDTNVFNPSFSPNGRLLTFALNDRGRQRIMVLDLTRTPARQRTPHQADAEIGADLVRPLPGAPDANAYFPSFVDDNHVAFTADLGTGLALYEESLSGAALYRGAEDPVGIARGVVADGQVIYSSYSGNGVVIREKAVESTPVAAAASESESSMQTDLRAPPAPSQHSVGRPYTDWPRFLFWMPLPYYNYLPQGATNLSLGFGAVVYGASLLGRNSYSAALTFRTDLFQPSIDLGVSSMIGTNTLGYRLTEGYAAFGARSFEQAVDQTLELTVPVVAEHLLGRTTTLAVIPGISDAISYSRSQPFGFIAPIENPRDFSFGHAYSLNLGLSFSRVRNSAAGDIYPRHDLRAGLQTQYFPSYLSDHPTGAGAVLQGTVSIPGFFPRQAVRFGIKSSYSSFTGSRTPVIQPRGVFIERATGFDPLYQQETRGRSIIAVDYLTTLKLLDIPLFFGLNLQGTALGAHLAAAVDWDPATRSFEPDHALYAGIELVSLIGYQAGGGPLPVGFGVSFRFDPTGSRPFDPLHDVGPYFFFSTNSFLYSITSTVGLPARGSSDSPLPRPRVDF